jgi:hypothetical protein
MNDRLAGSLAVAIRPMREMIRNPGPLPGDERLATGGTNTATGRTLRHFRNMPDDLIAILAEGELDPVLGPAAVRQRAFELRQGIIILVLHR